MPLATMGCAVLLHNKLEARRTWDNHAIHGTMLKHQESIISVTSMGQKCKRYTSGRHSIFKHQCITVPVFTKADATVATVTQLVKVIQDEVPTNMGETEKEQLTKLTTIFNTVAKKITIIEADK